MIKVFLIFSVSVFVEMPAFQKPQEVEGKKSNISLSTGLQRPKISRTDFPGNHPCVGCKYEKNTFYRCTQLIEKASILLGQVNL